MSDYAVEESVRNWFFNQSNTLDGPASKVKKELAQRLKEVVVIPFSGDLVFTPRQKECYNNAIKFSLHEGADLVFGFMVNEDLPIPIMHAWNAVEGSFVDITIQENARTFVETHRYFQALRVDGQGVKKVMEDKQKTVPFWDQYFLSLFRRAAIGENEDLIFESSLLEDLFSVPPPQADLSSLQ